MAVKLAIREDSGPTFLLLGLGGYFAYKAILQPMLLKPAAIKRYTGRFRVNIIGVHLKGDNITFDVYIQNVNDYPINIKAIVGDMFLISNNGKTSIKLGNINRYGIVTVKPIGETKYPITLRTKFVSLVQYFSGLLQGTLRGQIIKFVGNINIDGSIYPLNLSYKLV